MRSSLKHVEIALSGISKRKFTVMPEVNEVVNFKIKNGQLVDGLCLSPALFGKKQERMPLPEGFTAEGMFSASTANGERVLLSGKDARSGKGVIYTCDTAFPENGFRLLDGVEVDAPVFCSAKLNDADCVIFTQGDGRLFSYDGITASLGECPPGTVWLCTFKGKTLAVTDNCIYLSHGDAVTFSYEDGDVFYLPEGFHARKAVVFGDEVVIAGNRGVARLVQINFATAFDLRTVCADAELFYPETLAVCGEGAYLLSENGLAVFNGVTFTYSHKETTEGIVRGRSGFFCEGEYHASVEVASFPHKHAVFSYGMGVFYVSDACVLSAGKAEGGVQTVVLLKDKAMLCAIRRGYVSPAPVRRLKTTVCDFASEGRKVITEFSLRTEGTVTVRINADGRGYTFVVRGGEGRRSICPYVTGREFSFEIIYEGVGADVSGIQLAYECC